MKHMQQTYPTKQNIFRGEYRRENVKTNVACKKNIVWQDKMEREELKTSKISASISGLLAVKQLKEMAFR